MPPWLRCGAFGVALGGALLVSMKRAGRGTPGTGSAARVDTVVASSPASAETKGRAGSGKGRRPAYGAAAGGWTALKCSVATLHSRLQPGVQEML